MFILFLIKKKKSVFLFISFHFSLPSLLRLPLLSSSSSLHLCRSTTRRLATQSLAISSTHLANPQTHLHRPIFFLFLLILEFGWLGFFVCVWLIFAQIGIRLPWFFWLWLCFFFFLLWALVEVVVGVVVEVVVASWKVFVVDFYYYFILMNSLYFFNQIAKNIDILMLGVL